MYQHIYYTYMYMYIYIVLYVCIYLSERMCQTLFCNVIDALEFIQ